MKRWKQTIGFLVGVVVGALSVIGYQELSHELKPMALPVIERKGYTVAYDTRGKIPYWTHEHLTAESLQKLAKREDASFQEDPDVYRPHRSCLADYKKSGFDRGHIVPAGDEGFSKEALQETFYLSNICPQHPKFNRGIWKALEEHVRTLVKTVGPVEVVSGPLFLSHEEGEKRFVTYEVIGKNEVAVPTHFFKVIKTEEKRWAYVLPNKPLVGKLDDFVFPIERLEKISGIRF